MILKFRTRFSNVVVISVAEMFFHICNTFFDRNQNASHKECGFCSIFMTFQKGFSMRVKKEQRRAVLTAFLQLQEIFFMKNSKKWFALRAWKKVHAQNYE